MTIQRVEARTSRVNEWIRAAARALNAVLRRVDGNQASVSADYTVTEFDGLVFVNTGAAVTVTLPDDLPKNHRITVKDVTGGAGSNNITVSGSIDGGSSATITTSYGVKTFVSNGSGAWWEC